MAANRPVDKYSNVASIAFTQAIVNVLEYNELLTGISLGQGIGMVIDQIDYWIRQSVMEDLLATGDTVTLAWATSTPAVNYTTLGHITAPQIIHAHQVMAEAPVGTPASGNVPIVQPWVYQFFPGMIVAAPRLYFGIGSNGIDAGVHAASRIYFRYVELTPQEYLEIAEAFVLVG